MEFLSTVLILIIAYFVGAIPFGYIVGKHIKKIDITKHGSGNIGTTNAFRILGAGPASLVLLGDFLKGFFPTLYAMYMGEVGVAILVGLVTIVGHNWSIFMKFKGGRGVATGAGVVMALVPKVIIIAFFFWLAIVLITKYVSLASIVGAFLVPMLMIYFKEPLLITAFGTAAAIFVIYRHIPNIKRLLAGNELKIK
ncbi:glycerol-3-phosphate acyltransferase PlsY [Desulfitispora alkaliphila]|uniref:glycerol-3-phosphate 1-O-acyltransferase PlsY n=1 Tax=Desulfitispora alkaliphila TaxID=622674 RepID=UPI003D1AEED0